MTSPALSKAQGISTYDDETMREIIIPELITNFENALNVISFSGSEPLDFKKIKMRLLMDEEGPRMFYSDDIIVESDLYYDNYLNPIKEDQEIKTYLDNFNLLYKKTTDPTVSFTVVNISKLKKRDYFFYNVHFECSYNNKDPDGNTFTAVGKIAEIRLEFDSIWNAYINGIRFMEFDNSISDTQFVFTDFQFDDSRSTDSKMIQIAKKRELQQEKHSKLLQFMADGDTYYIQERYIYALEAYKRALPLEPYNQELREKINKTERAVETEKKNKRKNEERAVRINFMRNQAVKSFNDHDFRAFKLYADSLTVYYGLENDVEIRMFNANLSTVTPFISHAVLLESQGNYEAAKEYSYKTVKAVKKAGVVQDSLLLSEAYYWLAKEVQLIDSTETEQISENCQKALLYSLNRHMPANKLLIQSKLKEKNTRLEALEIASSLVNYDPKNPDLRTLRARVYYQLGDASNAIMDYQLAMDMYSQDSATYIEKARLEYSIGKNFNCISTASSGLIQFPCNHELYFLKILAQVELDMISLAGKDYQRALQCGMSGAMKDTVQKIGRGYFNQGMVFLERLNYDSCLYYFSKSYDLTKNLDALYFRGNALLNTNQFDKALDDLNILIETDSLNSHAYFLRGQIKAASGNHQSACMDFKRQVVLIPNYWKAYALKGYSELQLGRFSEAAKDYEAANRIRYTDTAAAQQVYALYMAKNYDEAVSVSKKYTIEESNTNPKFLKYKGMSEYFSKQYKNAEDNLKKVIQQNPTDMETSTYLILDYLAMGEPENGIKAADATAFHGGTCEDILTLKGVCYIAQQNSADCLKGINIIKQSMEKSKGAPKASFYSWIAYGYTFVGGDDSKLNENIEMAKKIDEKDPVLLFVKSCIAIKDPIRADEALSLLNSACAAGFNYSYLAKNDPGFRKSKYHSKIRGIFDNCTR